MFDTLILTKAAEIVYEGNLNKQFVMDVRKGLYPVFEGVIKTAKYFERLRHKFEDRWENYAE